MVGMTPRRRFLNALARKPPDRAPVASPTSVVTVGLQDAVGAFFPDAHRDPEQMAALALAGYTQLGYDAVAPVFAGGTHEAEALGVRVSWGNRGNMPFCQGPIWEHANEIAVPENFLEHPAIATVLQAIRILKAELGDQVAIIGKIYGPWSLAYHCFGLSRFLKLTIKDPAAVDAILEGLMLPAITFGNAQVKAGADALCYGAHITADLIHPDAYPRFLRDIDRRLVEAIGVPLIFHCCGRTMDRIEYFNESTMAAFHFESQNDPFEMRRRSTMVLIGNINNARTLFAGNVDDLRREVFRALDAGVDIIAPECAVPLNAKTENIRAVRDCVDEYYSAR